MASQNAPQPVRRTRFIKVHDNEWKERLTESFEGFNAGQVSRDHITKAEECIDSGGTREERYRLVPFERILNENEALGNTDYLTSMTSAYDLLLKFVINLLKPNRPPVWRSIKTNNTAFRARVACMKGYEDILKTAGYTEKKEDSLQFPENIQEPDKQKLYVIAAELLMARLEVDRMNPASQSHQFEGSPRRSSPSNQHRAQTAIVGGTTGVGVSGVSGVGSVQWGNQQQSSVYSGVGGGQMALQQHLRYQQAYQGAHTTMLGQPQLGSSHPGYHGPAAALPQQMPNQQQFQQEATRLGYHQSNYGQDFQSIVRQGPHPVASREYQGSDQWHRSQSEDALPMRRPMMNGSTRKAATENLGSPGQTGHPKPKPRIARKNTANRHGSQSSISSPSSTTSSLSDQLTPTEGEEETISAKKNIKFDLPAISEGGAENDGEDEFLRMLRERRMAAKHGAGGKKHVTEPDITNVEKRVGLSEPPVPTRKSYFHTTFHPTSSERLSQASPPLSSLRQPLTPPKVEPLPIKATPDSLPSGRGQQESEDSSSDQYSTPPTTAEHFVTTKSSGHTPQATPTPGLTDTGDIAIEKPDPVLEDIKRRRLELRQQREESGKKSDISPPATTETKTETKVETLPSVVPPTQLSTGANASHYILGDVSRQPNASVTSTPQSSSGIYCPRCHCTVRLGQKHCSYCNAPVYPFSSVGPRPGSYGTRTGTGTGTLTNGSATNISSYQDLNRAPGVHEGVAMLPVSSAYAPQQQYPGAGGRPTLSPSSGQRAAPPLEHNSLYDPSGLPKRASVPEDDVTRQQATPPPSHYSQPPPAQAVAIGFGQKQQLQLQQPLRARVDDNQPLRAQVGDDLPPSAYSQRYDPNSSYSSGAGGELPRQHGQGLYAQQQVDPYSKKAESSQASVVTGGTAVSGSTGEYTPSPGAGAGLLQYSLKLEKFREFLHKKGKSDAEIATDPEYLMMVEEERGKGHINGGTTGTSSHGKGPVYVNTSTATTSAPNVNAPQGSARVDGYGVQRSSIKKKPDMTGYDRVNLMATDNYSSENQRAMDKLKKDGQQLLEWIKMCTPFNYSLDEIQIAADFVRSGTATRAKNPLMFLDTDWAQMTRRVQNWVAGTHSERRPFVGKPTEDETRKALVEAKGNDRDAVDIIYRERKQKVDSLLKRFEDMREIQQTIPELSWSTAVDVLSVNGMDVNKACYAVQCDWLQPLYESINSEHKKLKQEEMAEIKALVSKKDDTFSKEARYRMLMAECAFDDQERAKLVLDLMDQVENDDNDYPLHYYVDAAHDFADLQTASEFLFKECPIQGFCAGDKIPIHEMITMPGCTHSLCKECFKGQFQMVIQEQGVKHFNCPICQKPDMSNKDDIQEMYELLFVNMIKEHLGGKIYELCQEKLKEFNLTKDTDFLWCANDKCGSGFLYEGDRTRPRDIRCPGCKELMCWKCKKPWEIQHHGISCEQFAKWKRDNDPEAQELGLAAHLNDNGIECPACHARYELARGGCMHFKCQRCPNEFCSGCGESLKKGKECGKFNSCATKGLHAHHPRDCLFYLRDLDVKQLQDFLKENKMNFDTEAPKEQIEAAKREKRKKKDGGTGAEEGDDAEGAKDAEAREGGEGGEERIEGERQDGEDDDDDDIELHCRVEEQKDVVDGLKDEVCGKTVEKGHAGLCKVHYKEYLVNIINQHGLDPVTIYDTDKIKLMLTREEMDVPEQDQDEETDLQYRERLIQYVQEKLKLTGGQKADEALQPQAAPAQAAAVARLAADDQQDQDDEDDE